MLPFNVSATQAHLYFPALFVATTPGILSQSIIFSDP